MRLVVVTGAFFFVVSWLPSDQLKMQSEFISPPLQLGQYMLGQRYAAADFFWIRALQDFSYCENPLVENVCSEKVWLRDVLQLITYMDPWNPVAYSLGALGLSVILSDKIGASALFAQGVRYYPNDWRLLSRAAYHFAFEEEQWVRAAQYFERASLAGGPEWLMLLAQRLYVSEDRWDLAHELALRAKDLDIPKGLTEQIQERLNSKQ